MRAIAIGTSGQWTLTHRDNWREARPERPDCWRRRLTVSTREGSGRKRLRGAGPYRGVIHCCHPMDG